MNLEKLYFLRSRHNLTQQNIADILGVSRVAISLWENSKDVIPLDKLNTYANYFNVSMDYLVGLTNDSKSKGKIDKLDKKIIGQNLVKFRKEFNYSQISLATLLKTSHSTISAYENGKTLILTAFAYQICLKHKISLDWLVGRWKK